MGWHKMIFDKKRKRLWQLKSKRTERGAKQKKRGNGITPEMIFDDGRYEELFSGIVSDDPLNFPGYKKKLEREQLKTGRDEAIRTGYGKIGGTPACVAVLDSAFFMGSMGIAVGQKVTALADYAKDTHMPLFILCSSGGARMQEGMYSLMQMAKTAAAIERFRRGGGLYVSVLMNPTMGGVAASFASLADITLALPGALIGFAGPRVIAQTIGEKLPDGFQSAQFQLEHGFVDRIVKKEDLKAELEKIIRLHGNIYPGGRRLPRESLEPTGVHDNEDVK